MCDFYLFVCLGRGFQVNKWNTPIESKQSV